MIQKHWVLARLQLQTCLVALGTSMANQKFMFLKVLRWVYFHLASCILVLYPFYVLPICKLGWTSHRIIQFNTFYCSLKVGIISCCIGQPSCTQLFQAGPFFLGVFCGTKVSINYWFGLFFLLIIHMLKISLILSSCYCFLIGCSEKLSFVILSCCYT